LYRHKLPTGIDVNAVAKLKTQLQQAEEKIRQLESRLKDAEDDAHIKAQEVSSGVVNTDGSYLDLCVKLRSVSLEDHDLNAKHNILGMCKTYFQFVMTFCRN
jgi:hypothetical protein